MSYESSRFAMLVFSMWVAAAMGIMWSFSVISNELKERYQISQSTMTWITTSGSAFGMFGLPAGLVFDFFGPPGALLIGGTITGLGSLMLSIALYATDSLGGYEPVTALAASSPLIEAGLVGSSSPLRFGDDNDTTIATTTSVTDEDDGNVTTTAAPQPTADPAARAESEPMGAVALIFAGYIFLLHGTTYLDVGGVMATLFVFPLDRGDVIMLTRTLTGLGGTFFVFLFNGFFVSKLLSRNPKTDGSSAKIYGQYMFACTAIIFAVCWSAALVIRYPIYHTSGFAAWRAKRALAATGGMGGHSGSFLGGSGGDDSGHATITDKYTTTDVVAQHIEAEAQREKEAAKQYYTTVRAAPRRLFIGLLTLGLVFTLFTTMAFLKAGKEGLPTDLVANLFGPNGNRAVSITSILLLTVLLPMMALPAQKEKPTEQPAHDDGFHAANNTGDVDVDDVPCPLLPGRFLDTRKAPKAATASTADEREEEGGSVNEKTGLVVGTTIVANPTYHKNACQHKTSFRQSITTVPLMWSLMFMAFVSWGAGATIISNSAQILRAANDNKFDEDLNNLMTSVVGVATALGRIFVGLVDRYYYHQVRHSSAIALPVGPASMLVGALLIVALPARTCYFGVAFTAFGYGLSWASTMLLVREAFEKDIGRVYYMCSTTAVISVIAFNRGLFGTIYDDRGREQGLYPNCSGIECVRLPMLVAIGLFAIGTLSAIATYFQWRRRLLADN